MELFIAIVVLSALVLVLILLRVFAPRGTDISPQLLDLKNQLMELKTRQIESQTTALKEQQQLLSSIMKTLGEGLSSSQSNITTQLKNSNDVINDIQKKLGSLEVTTRNIQEIGKDISSLQEILQAPKLRGNLGEYLLAELLKEIFPAKNYALKYSFRNGTQVDAIIRLGDGIVPVDSKFPLESFSRLVTAGDESDRKAAKKEFTLSVRRRIDEIADKYINPGEGTFDFAMMYIPAENVFYETIIMDSASGSGYEILNYAISRHIIPVSPNSFYAYLMALVYGLKGFRIEQQAKVIIGELSNVQSAFSRFYSDYELLGKHLGNAKIKYDDGRKNAEHLNDKVAQITGVKYDLVE